MVRILVPVFLVWASIAGQCQTTGAAATKGACSPANTGNNNTFNFTCGIGKEQGEQMLKILNKILAHQLNPDEVMAKLDEILKAVNPNLPVKTYFCTGEWRTAGPSATAGLEVSMGGDNSLFKQMADLNNQRQYSDLLKVCHQTLESTPGWLTPYLFCGLGYVASGDKEHAREMLSRFDEKRGPAYDAPACKEMVDFLRNQVR